MISNFTIGGLRASEAFGEEYRPMLTRIVENVLSADRALRLAGYVAFYRARRHFMAEKWVEIMADLPQVGPALNAICQELITLGTTVSRDTSINLKIEEDRMNALESICAGLRMLGTGLCQLSDELAFKNNPVAKTEAQKVDDALAETRKIETVSPAPAAQAPEAVKPPKAAKTKAEPAKAEPAKHEAAPETPAAEEITFMSLAKKFSLAVTKNKPACRSLLDEYGVMKLSDCAPETYPALNTSIDNILRAAA